MTVQEKFEALAKDKFFGIPVKDFEAGGKEQLCLSAARGFVRQLKACGYWLRSFTCWLLDHRLSGSELLLRN